MLLINKELRIELNITVKTDNLTLADIERIIKNALVAGLKKTSYGIRVDSVRLC
ncbi:MAG TPA: hypothetical protein VE971_00480 [Candidatus Eisenbacteria bacterium]|nr:hypothetical protein [Candidatus Eisenbacteria bacterium]